MKKITCIIISVLMITTVLTPLAFAAPEVEYSGQCGDNVYWDFDSETGVLTLSGTGETYEYGAPEYSFDGLYDPPKQPWIDFKDNIKKVVIQEGVTALNGSLFWHFTELSEVIAPESLEKVERNVFGRTPFLINQINDTGTCYVGNVLYLVKTDGKELFVKEGTVSVSEEAFYECNNLTDVYLPESLKNVYSGSFSSMYIKNLFVDENNPYFSSDDGILFNKDKSVLVLALVSVSGDYVVPDSVKIISDRAFSSCKYLTSIIIPDSVTTIGKNAFDYCKSLSEVVISNSLKVIESFVFENCQSLDNVVIPDSVTSIESYAFYSCSSLKSIEIPKGVKSIEKSAFSGCEMLKEVVLSDGLISIGDYAFRDCYSLKKINIPDSVTKIGEYAFWNCKSLTEAVLPNGLKVIEESVFDFCDALENVVVQDGVTEIDICAFSDCTSLKDIELPNSLISIADSAFRDCTSLKNVYYDGTEEEWNNIGIGKDNECLLNATIHFKTLEEEKNPAETTNENVPSDTNEKQEAIVYTSPANNNKPTGDSLFAVVIAAAVSVTLLCTVIVFKKRSKQINNRSN